MKATATLKIEIHSQKRGGALTMERDIEIEQEDIGNIIGNVSEKFEEVLRRHGKIIR